MNFEEDDERQLLQDFKDKIRKKQTPYYDSIQMEIILEGLFAQLDRKYITPAVALALNLFPREMIFHLYRVREHILNYELEKADNELKYIEQTFPPSVDIYIERIMLMHLIDPGYNTIPLIKEALQLEPYDEELLFMLCSEYCQRGKVEKALRAMRIILDGDENPEERFAQLTSMMALRAKFQECYTFYKTLTDEFPLIPSVWSYFGVACTFLEKNSEAIEAFQFALACDDQYTFAHFMLGQTYFSEKEYEKGIEHLSRTLEDDLFNFTAYRFFGDYEFLCTRYDEALRYYHQSLDLMTSEYALCGIIKTLSAMGRGDEAEVFVDQLISEKFIAPDAFADICLILIENGRQEQIPTIIDKTLPEYSNYRTFFEDFFDFILNQKEYQVGLDIIKSYFDTMSEYGISDDYYYYCAALHFLLDQPEEGIQILHDALLFNYEKHKIFISWSPTFAENEAIIDLIHKYKI